jgi:hypothetical protein
VLAAADHHLILWQVADEGVPPHGRPADRAAAVQPSPRGPRPAARPHQRARRRRRGRAGGRERSQPATRPAVPRQHRRPHAGPGIRLAAPPRRPRRHATRRALDSGAAAPTGPALTPRAAPLTRRRAT